jgi:hypothetical protein
MEEISETWASRELPILRVALRHYDAGERPVNLEVIRAETGFTADQVTVGADALAFGANPPYLEVALGGRAAGSEETNGAVMRVFERTRQRLGTWPTPENMLDGLIQALNSEADSASEDQKGRLRAAAEALSGVSREIAVRVIAARIGQSA